MATLPPSSYRKTWVPNVASTDSSTIGVGVIGGIPTAPGTPRNIVSYGADNTGASDAQPAIAAAYADVINFGGHISIPAGTFAVNTALPLQLPMYGAGMSQTTLVFTTGGEYGIQAGNGTQFTNPNGVDDDIIAGLTEGSTSVTIGYTGDFAVGKSIAIFISDDQDQALIEAGSVPFIMRVGEAKGYSRMHLATVTAIDSGTDTITFDKPIIYPIQASTTGYARASQVTTSGTGFSDMTMDFENASSTFAVSFQNVKNGFLQNVKIKRARRYHLFVAGCTNFEMRGCVLEDAQIIGNTNTAGLLMHETHGALVEDNTFYYITPGMEINFSTHGSAFTHNYFDRCIALINHGATNSYNLYEGNIFPQIKSDGYFGGSVFDCLFGNWATGRFQRTDTASTVGMVQLKRLTYRSSHVRNYYGTTSSAVTNGEVISDWGFPNIGNAANYGEAQPSLGDWWVAWNPAAEAPRSWTGTIASGGGTPAGVLTLDVIGGAAGFQAHAENAQAQIAINWGSTTAYATPVQGSESGNNYSITNVRSTTDESVAVNLPANGTSFTVVANTSSFQEKDLDVLASAYRSSNYYLSSTGGQTGAATGETAVGSDTIPESLFRSSKPSWFGDKPWPLFDTSRAAQPNYTDLPAAHRYINGNTDYIDATTVATPTVSPAATTYPTTQSVTFACSTVGATMRYTSGDGSQAAPTNSTGTVYSGAISTAATTTYKVIAYDGVLTDSAVLTATFTITPVPNAPSSLTASAVSTTQINLAWTDNASTETGFRILKGTTSGALTLHAAVATPGLTSYSVTGLTAGTAYFFAVQAYNAGGNSTSSNEATATTDADEAPASTGSMVCSGNITVNSINLG